MLKYFLRLKGTDRNSELEINIFEFNEIWFQRKTI